jgi:hypothetical protein
VLKRKIKIQMLWNYEEQLLKILCKSSHLRRKNGSIKYMIPTYIHITLHAIRLINITKQGCKK